MAESMTTRAEAGILLFATELEGIGHRAATEGLLRLLRQFKPKGNESADEMRRRIYRRFFGIMWFGSKIGEGSFEGRQPTYVYPPEMKAAIRAVIPGDVRDYTDPSGPKVYNVTLQDLVITKWPAASKSSGK